MNRTLRRIGPEWLSTSSKSGHANRSELYTVQKLAKDMEEIMAMNYADYPKNWKEIRAKVLERAKNLDDVLQCECVGECGRDHKGARCTHVQPGRLTTKSKYRVILTTAHLCHRTRCGRLSHLKSMCQPCHQVLDLRDRQRHRQGIARTRVRGRCATGRIRRAAKPRRVVRLTTERLQQPG